MWYRLRNEMHLHTGHAMKYFNFFVFFFFILTIPLYADESKVTDESSVKELADELYKNYEAVDKELNELKRAAEETQSSSLMAPIVISVRKGKGFRLISVNVEDEGKPIWGHIYNDVENNALDFGGRHELYRGVVTRSKHGFSISFQYQLQEDKKDITRSGVMRGIFDISTPSYLEVLFKKDGKDIKVDLRKYE